MNKLLFLLVSLLFASVLGCHGGVSVFGTNGGTVADDDDDTGGTGGAGGTGAGGTSAGGTGAGGTEEPCCSDCEYPAFLFDTLEIAVMLEDPSYNEFLNDLLADAMPPNGEDVILLFDPETEVAGLTDFDAAFGLGIVTGQLWSWNPNRTPAELSYNMNGEGKFISTDPDLTLQLSFGVTVPLQQAYVAGQFSQDWQAIYSGAITGAILEEDTEDIETSFGNLHDLMDGRPLDVDTNDDDVPDAWSFKMLYTAFQFLPQPTR